MHERQPTRGSLPPEGPGLMEGIAALPRLNEFGSHEHLIAACRDHAIHT